MLGPPGSNLSAMSALFAPQSISETFKAILCNFWKEMYSSYKMKYIYQ